LPVVEWRQPCATTPFIIMRLAAIRCQSCRVPKRRAFSRRCCQRWRHICGVRAESPKVACGPSPDWFHAVGREVVAYCVCDADG